MSVIEKNISQFIKNQFPAYYREEGESFVQFVTEYYKWMESTDNPLYHSRNFLDYKDIDETMDDFIIYFKSKFLADIQLDTVVQTRNLIKHSLDLYRSKGTPRSIDLFFRAIYGTSAEVYYPGDDVFRLSDGSWVKPKYLEVTPSEYNKLFVGKQIKGLNSGATAFVERYIRRKIKNKYIDVLYISAIQGEFVTDELLTIEGQNLKNIPKVIGSLTTLDIVTGGFDFAVGDIVNVESDNGVQGKARVISVSDITGTVDFELVDYGWGYTANAEVLISEKILYLHDVKTDSSRNFYFDTFETIKQPLANVVIINADATLSLEPGANLYTYYSNNALAGKGRVLSYTANGTTNGEVYVAEVYNTLDVVSEPDANLTGTVAVTYVNNPLTGISSLSEDSDAVTGTGTFFTSELAVGMPVTIYFYDVNTNLVGFENNVVESITNDTSFTLAAISGYSSACAAIVAQGAKTIIGTSTSFDTDFVYGDDVFIHSNSTNYITRTVDVVTNATYMTVQEPINFSNTSANYADAVVNYKIYTHSNAVAANISTRTDKSVTANLMGISSNLTIQTIDTLGTFIKGQTVYQLNSNNEEIASGTLLKINSTTGANVNMSLSDVSGVFMTDPTLKIFSRYSNGLSGQANAKIDYQDLNIGVMNVVSSFVTTNNNFIVATNSFGNATLTRVSTGYSANFAISDSLYYPEDVTLGDDLISYYANISLNATIYGFPAKPSANGDSDPLEDILKIENYALGGISILTAINPGKNYDVAPFSTIYEPKTASYHKLDLIFDIENPTGIFTVGELVKNEVSGYVEGIVKESTEKYVKIGRLKFDSLIESTNSIMGVSSGVTADVISISSDQSSMPIGLNSVIVANVQAAQGAVTSLGIIDSGFGYVVNETVDFTSIDGQRVGTAKVNLGKKGVAEGYYRDNKGQLSDTKYLFDGEYYQDYSYVIKSSISSDKYFDMLKKVVHVAGTKMFAETVITEKANTSTNVITDITVE